MATAAEKHPAGFKYIFMAELAERASFYGVMVLLMSFMTKELGFETGKAGFVTHTFKALAYVLPIFGGYIADRWLGKFKTVLVFSAPYILGHIIIGEWRAETGLYLALVLLAMGSGAIKPNVLPLMTRMYEEAGASDELRTKATGNFYAAINIGAVISMLAVPQVRTDYGYQAAFLLPAGLMIMSLIIFWLGRKYYPKEGIENTTRVERTAEDTAESWRIMKSFTGIFVCYIFFWFIYDQYNTTWVTMAEGMERYGLKADTIQWLNPALIMVFVPLSGLVWHKLKEAKIDYSPTDKMFIGFLLTGATTAILGVSGFMVESGGQPSLGWQVAAYVVLGMAEMCLSVVGLDFVVSTAPERMRSQMLAVFFLTIFLGNLVGGVASTYYETLGAGWYFTGQTILILAVGLVFRFVAKRFNQRAGREAVVQSSTDVAQSHS